MKPSKPPPPLLELETPYTYLDNAFLILHFDHWWFGIFTIQFYPQIMIIRCNKGKTPLPSRLPIRNYFNSINFPYSKLVTSNVVFLRISLNPTIKQIPQSQGPRFSRLLSWYGMEYSAIPSTKWGFAVGAASTWAKEEWVTKSNYLVLSLKVAS